MIAGVPGAGISAFFYLLCVLLMPFSAAWRMARGANPRWPMVLRQVAIGGGILAGLVAGGAIVSAIAATGGTPVQPGQVGRLALDIGLTLGRIGIFLGIGTLVLVMGSVQLYALIARRRGAPRFRPHLVPAPAPRSERDDLWSTRAARARPGTGPGSTNGHGPGH
jgi:hypothetical protein